MLFGRTSTSKSTVAALILRGLSVWLTDNNNEFALGYSKSTNYRVRVRLKLYSVLLPMGVTELYIYIYIYITGTLRGCVAFIALKSEHLILINNYYILNKNLKLKHAPHNGKA